MDIKIVIGKNFGDEGKGLATDYFASKSENALVIKHNGGAQAGHTVDKESGRFVFHQLSSGSFYSASTYLAKTFCPDLLKLPEEIEDFRKQEGIVVPLYIDANCKITTVYDVILNSIIEEARGNARHGSCGMGIFETVVRNSIKGYKMELDEFACLSMEERIGFLEKLRCDYVPKRLAKENITLDESSEWYYLLSSGELSVNAAYDMSKAYSYFTMVTNPKELIKDFNTLIFEGAQGLMLDWDNEEYAPHLTASKTGSANPVSLLNEWGVQIDEHNTEVCYVTRSYVTRHGAGRLDYEISADQIPDYLVDQTNVYNKWQDNLRFALHPSDPEVFWKYIKLDLKEYASKPKVSLLITHLNETNGKLLGAEGLAFGDDIEIKRSQTPYSKDIV